MYLFLQSTFYMYLHIRVLSVMDFKISFLSFKTILDAKVNAWFLLLLILGECMFPVHSLLLILEWKKYIFSLCSLIHEVCLFWVDYHFFSVLLQMYTVVGGSEMELYGQAAK